MGDLLFAIANLSRKLGSRARGRAAPRQRQVRARFTELERRLTERGVRMQTASLDALEAEWQAMKRDLR